MPIFKKASVAPIVRTVISWGIDDENNTDPAFEQAELGKEIDDSFDKFMQLSPQEQYIDELDRLENYYGNIRNNDYQAGIQKGLSKALELAKKYLR
jgi:hypothetical protein